MDTKTTNFIYQPLGPALMVYDQPEDKVHILNETAALILRLYQQGCSSPEIELELKKRYAVGAEQNVGQDISLVLNQMEGYGLI